MAWDLLDSIELLAARQRAYDPGGRPRRSDIPCAELERLLDRANELMSVAELIKTAALLLGCIAPFLPAARLPAATVEHDLTIAEQEVNFTGKPVQVLTINGSLPGRHCASR